MSGRLQAGPRFDASLVLRPLRLIVMAIGAVSILLIAYPVARAFAALSTKKRIVSDQEGWAADDEEDGDSFETSLVGVRERAWARRVIGVLALLLFMSIAAPFGLIAPAPVEAAHETVTHIHLVIGSTAADCTDGGTGMTSTTSDPGTLVPLVVCVHNSAHQPVDTAANTVLWFSFGVAGSTINSTENQSNVQGIAKAFATSSALGTQFVFACYDHSSDGACSGGNDFSSGVTVNWIDPDLHLAFTPTDPPSGSDHDCSAGPVVTSTVVGTPIEFVACAHNQTGTALSDARVTPTVASGSGPITPAWASTTASGRATFTVTPTTTGDLVITATAVYKHTSLIFSSNTVTATVTTPPGSLDHLHLAFSPPNGDAHSCSAGPTTSDTDVDTPREFVACAQDESHNPAPGAVVTPTLDSGIATSFSPPAATTDGSGRATFTMSATETGQSVVTATASKDTATVVAANLITNTWTAGSPATITLEPSTATNIVGSPHVLTATTTDSFGNPVSDGTVVTFTVVGEGATVGTSNVNGGEGRATFSFTSTQAGSSTITATTEGSTQTITSDPANKNWHHGPPQTVTVIPSSDTNTVGDTHTVTATATDEFGNPIAGHGATLTVTGAGDQVQTASTDGGGVVVFSFTSTQPGTSQITVTVWSDGGDVSGSEGSASGTATKDWTVGLPAQITLEPEQASNLSGDTHTVTATVTDEFGNVVADGTNVTFTVIGKGATSGTDTTSGGEATFSFTSTQAGASTITAAAQGETQTVVSNDAIKFWSVPPAIVTLDPPTATNAAGTSHTVTATVEDAFGNPYADDTVVTFTVVGEGETVGTALTSIGEATFSFVATQVGSSTITASVQGATQTSTSDPVNKTWHHGPPQTVTVVPSIETNTVEETHSVTATATDEFGNRIANHGATLTVTGAGDHVQTGSTDAEGVVVFDFTSTQAGTSQITITVWSDGGDVSGSEGTASGTATKNWSADLPAQISLEPTSANNAIGDTHTMTASVTDRFGNRVADGTIVTFTVIGMGATSGTGTTSGGDATFSFSSTQAGNSTITATAQGETQTVVSNQATKFWSGPPATITLEPATATNAAGTTHTVTASVTGIFGNPVADDTPVTFTVTGQGATSGISLVSGGQGQATFSFTSTQAGSSTVTATVQGQTQTLTSNAVTKSWHHAAPDEVLITPPNATNTVGETHTVTGTATDQFDNPIANHGATLTVTGAGAQTKTGNTDSGGVVVFTFTSTQPGASQITITVWSNGSDASGEGAGSAFGTASKQWNAGGGANITLDPPTATNAAGDTHTVTATVEDEFGNPVADGIVVTFTVTGLGATVGTSAVSGGQGEATFSFSSTQSGSSTITATVQGQTQTLTSNQVTKDWHHAAPAAISFSPADPTEFEGNTITFVATATDQYGNAISNHDVDFSKSGKPGTVPASDTTNGSGVVTFSVYSTTTGIQVLTMTVSSDGSDASGAGAGAMSASNVVTWVGKRFTSLPPLRILDTRADNETGNPIGTCTPACATIPPNSSIEVEITGHGGVPFTGVGAAKLNATIAGPTAPGFLTLYPKGQAQPVVSNLNFVPGDVRANLATVKVGTGGRIIAFNGSTGPLDVVFDIAGWYGDGTQATQGGSFVSVNPDRLLDTRDNTGGTSGPIPPDGLVTLNVLGAGGVPTSGVTAVVLNATVDDAKSSGFLTIYPAGQARPLASNINFTAGRIVPNLTAVKVGSGGQVVFFNGSPNTIEIVADVFGYFTAPSSTVGGGSIEPLDPSRILDTRGPLGSCSPSACAAIGPGQTIDVQVSGLGGVPPGAQAVVLNATVDQPTARGFLTIFPSGQGVPLISNLNFEPGQTVPNLVMIRLGQSGKVTIYNGTSGTVHVILDVGGWFRPTLT